MILVFKFISHYRILQFKKSISNCFFLEIFLQFKASPRLVLYALYVSPLFDLTLFHAFADDSQVMEIGVNIAEVVEGIERTMKLMINWPRDSGMSVNEDKIEICLFHKSNQGLFDNTVNNVTIRSINILDVQFDSKWTESSK